MTMAHQRETINNLVQLGQGLEWYKEKNHRFPVIGEGTADRLAPYLKGKYLTDVPTRDGWGTPLFFSISTDGYTIWSNGADRRRDKRWVGGFQEDLACDLVYRNGVFLQGTSHQANH